MVVCFKTIVSNLWFLRIWNIQSMLMPKSRQLLRTSTIYSGHSRLPLPMLQPMRIFAGQGNSATAVFPIIRILKSTTEKNADD